MSFVTYAQVVDGLHERFATVAGIDSQALLKYEPEVVEQTPLLYTLLDGFARDNAGQVTMMRYRILNRLVLQWQGNNELSEQELMSFVHSIPAAVDADPTLGARITMGLAKVSEGQSGFVIISSTKYRCLDFFVEATTKAPVRSGI